MDSPRRAATDDEARAMASATRLRILRLCLDEPLTNKQIAQRLGRDPASVLYHVRRLVRTGFLVPEPERRGARGAREVPYRATGKSWVLHVVDPALDRAGTAAVFEAFLADVRDVGVDQLSPIRLALRLTPQARAEFGRRVIEVLEEYRRSPDPDGEPWSVFVALHPDRRGPAPAALSTPPPCLTPNSGADPGTPVTPLEDDD
jgi:DNA-binding transcriptional ArsR family regulator